MRYTAMMWMRRANMAALGGGADIMPEVPIDWPEHDERYENGRCVRCVLEAEAKKAEDTTSENPD